MGDRHAAAVDEEQAPRRLDEASVVISYAEPVALMLENLIDATAKHLALHPCLQQEQHHLLPLFESRWEAPVSLTAYVRRLFKYSGCTRGTVVAMLALFDRIIERNPTFIISQRSIHRVLLATTVLALKFWEDFFYANAFLARVGGIPAAELKVLEVSTLALLHFELYLSPETYLQFDEALSQATHCLVRRKAAQALTAMNIPLEKIALHKEPIFCTACDADGNYANDDDGADDRNQQLFAWFPSSGAYLSRITVSSCS
eukprot:TRINITY_DN3917_c0_g1_i1.p1 TRINITY_DN3917_c0_g1~~TRINITY_DN3917_c0_g1_i1.p1  ORF type:complete len:259 (-),score=70.70 TRINITY_DN3917_c0_g1_i1:176-952(-)